MSRVFVIVGAGDISETKLTIPSGAFVIAADAGLEHLNSAGIAPDLIVGDFDSLGEVPSGGNVVAHEPEKDDTDMLLAVKEALARNAETIVIYGGMGGRPDHEYANIQTLAYIANKGAIGYLIGRGTICTAVKNGCLAFGSNMKGTISVFCVGDKAEGVDLVGLKYPLNNHTLTCDYPLGVSNEFTAVPSTVLVRAGMLTVMWSDSEFDFRKMPRTSKH